MNTDEKLTPKYVLMTAARNEELHIEKTLKSVVCQTILPEKWVIVNDNSKDGTRLIVEAYVEKYDFIKLINLSGNLKRDFSSKVYALNTAYKLLQDLAVDFVGVLDADISLECDYYEEIIKKFSGVQRLALAGGTRYDYIREKFRKVMIAPSSVGGPVQMFRKSVFDEIGGFVPLELGGEDAVAEIRIRQLGWIGKSFPDLKVYHHRPTGSEGYSSLKSRIRDGERFYLIGYHPLFQIFRSLFRVFESPVLMGSICYILGYLFAACCKKRPDYPKNYIRLLQAEQLHRLKMFFLKGKDVLD